MSNQTYKLNGQRAPRHVLKYTVLVLSLILIVSGAWFLGSHGKGKSSAAISKTFSKTITSTANTTTVTGKYLFSGTVMLGRAVETYAAGNYSQPFSGMASLGNYDANIGVFECPITTNADSYENQVNNLIFNCNPNWVPTLKKYFPILNLSSDHLNDQGPQGITDTFNYLHTGGIQTVGTFNPHTQKDQCNVIILPAHETQQNGQSTEVSLPIAICSYNYKIVFSPQPGELENIQKWSKIMPVIALMNGGPEYEHTAGSAQVSVAHQMIDEGADFVVGNGTHWVQNTEIYKGKLIVYSMGNFIFDQLDQDGRDALNLAVSMSASDTPNLQKWLQIGDSCQSVPDSCNTKAASAGLIPYAPHYTFSVIGSYGGYLQVATKANPAQESYIEQRANWSTTESTLAKETGY